jgi:PEP-CTERM motif
VEFFAAPVPEPSTYALLIAGLFGVAAAVRRRQQG